MTLGCLCYKTNESKCLLSPSLSLYTSKKIRLRSPYNTKVNPHVYEFYSPIYYFLLLNMTLK